MPSSYGIRALKRETEKLALEVIWAEAERRKRSLINAKEANETSVTIRETTLN